LGIFLGGFLASFRWVFVNLESLAEGGEGVERVSGCREVRKAL
jgi:hypothetical protein